LERTPWVSASEGEAETVGIVPFCEISKSEPMAKLELNEQNFLKRRLGEKLR
jgi:hypothetical protein